MTPTMTAMAKNRATTGRRTMTAKA
jgi:hypothetical protein